MNISLRVKSDIDKSNVSVELFMVHSYPPQSSFLSPFQVSLFCLQLALFQDGSFFNQFGDSILDFF